MDKLMLELPKVSVKGRTAAQVARAVKGLPFKVDNQVIGEVIQSWTDIDEVVIRVKFNRRLANLIKEENVPLSEQELPEEHIYRLNVGAWDRVFDSSLRIKPNG